MFCNIINVFTVAFDQFNVLIFSKKKIKKNENKYNWK